ncbi:MAG: hypothetical protein ACKVQK_17790 [Burkholderiales bacterium]
MGITMSLMKALKDRAIFSRRGLKVLDIGSSNLYQADTQSIVEYVSQFGEVGEASELQAFAERLSEGSAYDHVKGGLNESFAGELIERCGMSYLSMDIARGYKTEILDLNHENLPSRHGESYDVVLNIGTTEHVFNQYNSFKVIHEAARAGGYMVHQLPAAGYTDHGYFMYAGRMFFELASYNKYEIVDIWYDGPAGEDDLYLAAKRYSASIPLLERLAASAAARIPNYMITVIYKKMGNAAFVGMLETSTSVGDIPVTVSSAYASSAIDKLRGALRGSQYLRSRAGAIRRIFRHVGIGRK